MITYLLSCTVSTLRSNFRLNYSVFWCWYVMSCCDVDLWPDDLESLWYIKRYVIKVCTKFPWNRAIPGRIIDNFANFCARYVTLWLWPLTSWPWTFISLCTKFERNWIIHGWVIDDLARFRRAILGVKHDWQTVLGGAWTQLHQTWPEHRAIIPMSVTINH